MDLNDEKATRAIEELLSVWISSDEALIRRVAAVAKPARWRQLGQSPQWVWGQCKSGGIQWFRVVWHKTQLRGRCNCSVPAPCKHIWALRAMWHLQPELFLAKAEPDWVVDMGQTPVADEAVAAQRRAAARQRTQQQRLLHMQAGARFLEQWLADVLREGLAVLAGHDAQWWAEVCARLVDAKLGSLARHLEVRVAPLVGQALQWPERVAAELAWLHLLARALIKWDELPQMWKEEVMQLVGAYKRKAVLEQLPEVCDEWLVLSVQETQEGDLYVRRAWLWGRQHEHIAMLIDYAYDDKPWQPELTPNMWLWAAGVWYPSPTPLRFRVFRWEVRPAMAMLPCGHRKFSTFAQWYAELLAHNPFVRERPVIWEKVWPAFKDARWWLVDEDQHAIPMDCTPQVGWQLFALSAGEPVRVFGQWDGFVVRPLTAWKGAQCTLLCPYEPLQRYRRTYGNNW